MIFVIRLLPASWGYWLSDRLAWMLHGIDGARRRRALRNVALSLPDRSPEEGKAIVKACYRNIIRVGYEMVMVEKWLNEESVATSADFRGLDKWSEALSGESGVVLVGAHFGNWEVAGVVMGLLGHPITAVGRGVDNPLFDALLKGLREKFGLTVIKQQGAARTGRRIVEDGGNLYFTADQHARVGRIWVSFFGRPTAWSKTPASLAHRMNVPMITGVCRRVGPGFQFKANLFPPILPDPSKPVREDVGRMVQTYARFVEDCIREHPEDYLWLHRRWRTPSDGDELMRDDGTYVRHATFEPRETEPEAEA